MVAKLPLNKRDFDVFLSHRHRDASFVEQIDAFLRVKAGFSVWYDARELAGGALLASDLQSAIERCRSILIVASDGAVSSGWVKNEYNAAMDERANQPGFRVVPLRVGNANVDGLMQGSTWIDVPEKLIDERTALSIVQAFYPGEHRPNPATARDVYVSCSWQTNDNKSARAVCLCLIDQGFRLIGDSKDQQGFGGGDRVKNIIGSCGAFVSVLPFRGEAIATRKNDPYEYFIREIGFADELGMPRIIIADPRIGHGQDDGQWLHMDTDATTCPVQIAEAIELLWEQWRYPPNPHYIFYAMDLQSASGLPVADIRHLIERITGMSTVIGTEVQSESLHSAIMMKVCKAFLVLADITDDNVNACIEAGMGLAIGANVRLIAAGKDRNPPFMLRGAGQLSGYNNNVERIAIVHKIMRDYRRRVINAALG
jgi:hypothetical protein